MMKGHNINFKRIWPIQLNRNYSSSNYWNDYQHLSNVSITDAATETATTTYNSNSNSNNDDNSNSSPTHEKVNNILFLQTFSYIPLGGQKYEKKIFNKKNLNLKLRIFLWNISLKFQRVHVTFQKIFTKNIYYFSGLGKMGCWSGRRNRERQNCILYILLQISTKLQGNLFIH